MCFPWQVKAAQWQAGQTVCLLNRNVSIFGGVCGCCSQMTVFCISTCIHAAYTETESVYCFCVCVWRQTHTHTQKILCHRVCLGVRLCFCAWVFLIIYTKLFFPMNPWVLSIFQFQFEASMANVSGFVSFFALTLLFCLRNIVSFLPTVQKHVIMADSHPSCSPGSI